MKIYQNNKSFIDIKYYIFVTLTMLKSWNFVYYMANHQSVRVISVLAERFIAAAALSHRAKLPKGVR